MPAERLRDTNENWGLTPAEYARRARLRDRMKKRQQRARMKMEAPAMFHEQPVENPREIYTMRRLKGKDIQELGIIAVMVKKVTRAHPNGYYALDKAVPMSLPYVSILHGARQT